MRNEEIMVVVGGHLDDKCQIAGGFKAVNPTTTNFDTFDVEKLPFIFPASSPNQESVGKPINPPEPGCLVKVKRSDPSNPSTGIAESVYSFTENSMKPEAGNSPLYKWINMAQNLGLSKNIPSEAKTKTERGAKIRDIDSGEKGEWMSKLTKGLPVHLALSALMGQRIPQNKKIDTAKKAAIGIPSDSMLSQLPGSNMSISSLLSNLTKKQKKQATQNMDEELLNAFESLSYLITDIQEESASLIGNRVHEETFIANAIALLQQATSISDLLTIFDRLRYDTTLFGLDKLANVEFRSNTAYGQIVMTLDALGNLTFDSNSQNLLATAASTLTSSMGGSQGGDPGKNLFGDAAQNMQQAFERLAGGGEEFRNKLVRDVVEKTKNARHDAGHKYVLGEGNPLSIFNLGA